MLVQKVLQSWITFPVGSPSRIAHTAVKNNLIRAGVVNADESTPDDTAASAETKTETSRTPVRTVTPSGDAVEEVVYEDGSTQLVIAGTDTPINKPKEKPNKLVTAYPPVTDDGQTDTVSANKMADDMITNKSSNTAEQIQENLTQSGYSPDYIKIVVDKVTEARKIAATKRGGRKNRRDTSFVPAPTSNDSTRVGKGRNRSRTGNAGLASGGLMSRK